MNWINTDKATAIHVGPYWQDQHGPNADHEVVVSVGDTTILRRCFSTRLDAEVFAERLVGSAGWVEVGGEVPT